MKIEQDYGSRLVQRGGNAIPLTLRRLIASYSSHGFVIERTEIEDLFQNVKTPDDVHELFIALEQLLGSRAERPVEDQHGPRIQFLSAPPAEQTAPQPAAAAGPDELDPISDVVVTADREAVNDGQVRRSDQSATAGAHAGAEGATRNPERESPDGAHTGQGDGATAPEKADA